MFIRDLLGSKIKISERYSTASIWTWGKSICTSLLYSSKCTSRFFHCSRLYKNRTHHTIRNFLSILWNGQNVACEYVIHVFPSDAPLSEINILSRISCFLRCHRYSFLSTGLGVKFPKEANTAGGCSKCGYTNSRSVLSELCGSSSAALSGSLHSWFGRTDTRSCSFVDAN